MQTKPSPSSTALNRRQFIKTSALAASAAMAAPAILRADTKPAINAIVIGLGGRGSGAAGNFLEAAGIAGVDAKIVAVADAFPEVAKKATDPKWLDDPKWVNLPEEKCFSGFDAYQKALAVPGVNYVILATPPGFRASHFKAAVEAGKNIFTEKPVAVDGPGARVMYSAADVSKQKGLKVAAGTQRRHQASYIETIKRIQDGAIGDIMDVRAYWVNGGPIWHRGDHGDSDIERQVRNWYHYIWLCGDHICEQHVHNIDVANWIMGAHPIKAWGMGARQQLLGKSGEIWDNFAVEFEYPNGVRSHSYCGQVTRQWASVSEAVQATKGWSDLSRATIHPKGGEAWRFREKSIDPYVQEHVDLMNAITKDTELNEARQVTDSTLTAIMGREAAYSGAGVEWDTVLNSTFHYGPDLIYENCAGLQWTSFRTLEPPMPGSHNIFKNPPMLPVAKA
ncbi:MAG: oxidoreductase [Verrucomicrobia bacterium]|nr:MAG: oxidoreductase [Verrucomicrobiota bacterium]